MGGLTRPGELSSSGQGRIVCPLCAAGNHVPAGKRPPPDLRPPPPVPGMMRSLSTTDVAGARPRMYLAPGEVGAPRERRQERVTNWTIDAPRHDQGRPKPTAGEFVAAKPMGVGMWWAGKKEPRS